jgi:TPR repeat protein
MIRTFLTLIIATTILAGCGDRHAHIEPVDAILEAQDAFEDGEIGTGLRLLKSAGRRGDIHALAYLADAYESGYVRVSTPDRSDIRGEGETNVAFWTWPWEAGRWRRAHEAELERGVAAGEPLALLARVRMLEQRRFVDRRWREPSEEDLVEARSILVGLAEQGSVDAMVHLGVSTPGMDREEGLRWLSRAEAAGHPQACWFRLWFYEGDPRFATAAELVVSIDRAEVCHAMDRDQTYDFAAETVSTLGREGARANEAAVTSLDSLRILGVFDRHPRLSSL